MDGDRVDFNFEAAFAGRKVMITGGLGFIGSNLAHRLVGLGASVLLVDPLIPDYGGNIFNINGIENLLEVSHVDVRDEQGIAQLLPDQDYLFNLAGQTSHLDSMRDPRTDLEINCRAQLSLLEACRKINPRIKLTFASTRQVYGRPSRLPVDESHPVSPVDVNGINKVAGEWYHTLYSNVYGLRACALRLTNTYGPRMRVQDARQTFLGVWIRQLLEGKEIKVFGEGSQLRDFTYVDDAVDAFLRAAVSDASNGQTFNLGGDGPISLRQLAELLVALNGEGRFAIVPFPADLMAIDIGDYYADDQKIRTLLQWHPRTPLNEGLARTLKYYREHGRHYWNHA